VKDPTQRVRRHFRGHAVSFDALYDEDRFLQRRLRPGLSRRRRLAVAEVRAHDHPRVLDLGCGSGRVAEEVLDAGAADYVGIDFSESMLELARGRLARFGPRAQLIHADFTKAPPDETFDIVLALGVFDYLPAPVELVKKVAPICSVSMVVSAPRWSPIKGPIRKFRYEVLNDCPIFNYTQEQLSVIFQAGGFSEVQFLHRGRGGFFVRARP
jgi:ubiquinone/menaquinone biosynthesis C-methylase UbiE